MTVNKIAINAISKKIAEGMYQGNMHNCLRDAGRMIGGYMANGYITATEADSLKQDAINRCIDKKLGKSDIEGAIADGYKNPLDIEFQEYDIVNGKAIGFDEPLTRKPRRADTEILKKSEPEKFTKIVDSDWIEKVDVPPPPNSDNWQAEHFSRYVSTMFKPHEQVGICINTWTKETDDGIKFLPDAGFWDRTASELVTDVKKKKGSLAKVLGDHNKEAGVWVRINPLDGQGAKDVNVTAYRHTLIEADGDELGKQLKIIQDLQLPCTFVVHSGKKSLHAIVKIDAKTIEEYKSRVEYLHGIANANGLKADPACKNPSRLTRLPGFERSGNQQYIVSDKCGLPDWETWVDWIEDKKDDLPDFESMGDLDFDNLPEKSPELIHGLLRMGHKMTLTGPSKAGKSVDLMELSVAIASGTLWHEMRCTKGKVLYINSELDPVSSSHRVKDIFDFKKINRKHRVNIDFWHLRGKNRPLNLIAPKLIRRALKLGYTAIIIDPIYKLLTGDENSAKDMSDFTNLFDTIAAQLKCSVICCHHHSKGIQGTKRSADRGSGSGVFSRDPDAILDLLELQVKPSMQQQLVRCHSINAMIAAATSAGIDTCEFGDDELENPDALFMALTTNYPKHADAIRSARAKAIEEAGMMSAWRIESTLREFAKPSYIYTWYLYPVHIEDFTGMLADAKPEGEEAPWQRDKGEKKDNSEAKQQKEAEKRERSEAKKQAAEEEYKKEHSELVAAIKACGGFGVATKKELEAEMRRSEYQIRNMLNRHGFISRRTGNGQQQAIFGTL